MAGIAALVAGGIAAWLLAKEHRRRHTIAAVESRRRKDVAEASAAYVKPDGAAEVAQRPFSKVLPRALATKCWIGSAPLPAEFFWPHTPSGVGDALPAGGVLASAALSSTWGLRVD